MSRSGSAPSTTPYGLAIGKGACVVPVGVRCHLHADNAVQVPAGSAGSMVYRTFQPLSDPNILDVLPVFSNPFAMTGRSGSGDVDAPNAITIAAAVEMSDGTINPFTFNGGNHTVTIPAGFGGLAIPDAPVNIGAQVSANDKFGSAIALKGFVLRVWVQTSASRVDTAGITSASATVTDTSITAADQGAVVTGTGIPGSFGNGGQTYVGTVTPGTSFLLSSDPYKQVNVNATATNAAASLTISRSIPVSQGPYSNSDGLTVNGSADLTLPNSGGVGGGSGSFLYGPSVILGRSRLRKPIVGLVSDSILDGYSEDFHSTYFGPVARACVNLAFPFVKASKGGETALDNAAGGTTRYRARFFDGVTHAIVSLGTNDGALTTGAGAGGVTTMQTRLGNVLTWLQTLGIKAYLCTMPPRTSSTDSWATTTNQTAVAGSQITYLAQLNQWIRAVPAGWSGVYDLAGDVMSAQDSGLWAPGSTADGVHPSSALMTGVITTNLQALMSTWSV